MLNNVFENLTILDISEDVSGSFCARLFADYGAHVLKIEPIHGAKLRTQGPFFENDPHSEKSFSFFTHNFNKKGITLDIESAIGKDIFKDLVSSGLSMYAIGLGLSIFLQNHPGCVCYEAGRRGT